MKKLKPKNGDAQKKRSGHEVRGVSPEAGRESMVGKICERGSIVVVPPWTEPTKDGVLFLRDITKKRLQHYCFFPKIHNAMCALLHQN